MSGWTRQDSCCAFTSHTYRGGGCSLFRNGFTENPVEKLRSRLPFLRLSTWLLAHPTALLG